MDAWMHAIQISLVRCFSELSCVIVSRSVLKPYNRCSLIYFKTPSATNCSTCASSRHDDRTSDEDTAPNDGTSNKMTFSLLLFSVRVIVLTLSTRSCKLSGYCRWTASTTPRRWSTTIRPCNNFKISLERLHFHSVKSKKVSDPKQNVKSESGSWAINISKRSAVPTRNDCFSSSVLKYSKEYEGKKHKVSVTLNNEKHIHYILSPLNHESSWTKPTHQNLLVLGNSLKGFFFSVRDNRPGNALKGNFAHVHSVLIGDKLISFAWKGMLIDGQDSNLVKLGGIRHGRQGLHNPHMAARARWWIGRCPKQTNLSSNNSSSSSSSIGHDEMDLSNALLLQLARHCQWTSTTRMCNRHLQLLLEIMDSTIIHPSSIIEMVYRIPFY